MIFFQFDFCRQRLLLVPSMPLLCDKVRIFCPSINLEKFVSILNLGQLVFKSSTIKKVFKKLSLNVNCVWLKKNKVFNLKPFSLFLHNRSDLIHCVWPGLCVNYFLVILINEKIKSLRLPSKTSHSTTNVNGGRHSLLDQLLLLAKRTRNKNRICWKNISVLSNSESERNFNNLFMFILQFE